MVSSLTFIVVLSLPLIVLALLARKVSKKYTARGLFFFCLGILGIAMMCSTKAVATRPSSAPRITLIGRCRAFQTTYVGKVHRFLFNLVRDDGSQIPFQTDIDPPATDHERYIPDGELLQVIYLDEASSRTSARVTSLKILSGPHSGWHRSLDANWLGAWLLFPGGLTVVLYAMVQMAQNRRAVDPTTEANEANPQIIDLGL